MNKSKLFSKTSFDDFLKERIPMDIPPMPTKFMQFMDLKKKGKVDPRQEEKFMQRDEIQAYTKRKWEAELHNRDTFLILLELREYYNEADPEYTRINQAIANVVQAIQNQTDTYKALKLDLSKYDLPPIKPKQIQPEVQSVVDEVNGEIVGWDE